MCQQRRHLQQLLACAALVLCLTISAQAHSHLARPLPTRRLDCRVGNGRPRNCYGPCPPLDSYGEPTGISPNRPAEVWRRGERRTITWHRNNHGTGESGFVRFTLVPVNKMMDKSAHEKFTFQISCWSSGVHSCRSRNVHVCGNDADGKAYHVPIVVPSAYPDGVYAFGWAWYGGGDYKGRSFFGDYYSCSFVHIRGGERITSSSKPVFTPGINTKYNDACVSATNRVGQCYKEPCHVGHVQKMTPRNLPRSIFQRDIDGNTQSNYQGETEQYQPQRPEKEQRPWRGTKNQSSFKIEGLQIIDINKNRMRVVNKSKVKVRVADFKRGFTLGLKVSGAVDKVLLEMQGYSRTEYQSPYVINGNMNGAYSAISCRKGQKLRLKCTVYGRGSEQQSVSYKVKCI